MTPRDARSQYLQQLSTIQRKYWSEFDVDELPAIHSPACTDHVEIKREIRRLIEFSAIGDAPFKDRVAAAERSMWLLYVHQLTLDWWVPR